MARALEAGVDYSDTAPIYGDGASRRTSAAACASSCATAWWWGPRWLGAEELDSPADGVRRSLESSLAWLGTDHVELLHLHNPIEVDGTARP